MKTPPALLVIALASTVYWPDADELRRCFEQIAAHLASACPAPLDIRLIHGAPTDELLAGFDGLTAVLLPLSGGVQPTLVNLSARLRHAALANAYLPGFLPAELGSRLLHRNAHPACTDFFAHARLAGRPARWLDSTEALH
ncbi:MAG TPA: hypothetical protein VIO38_13850, partial [Rariglobus sp.]